MKLQNINTAENTNLIALLKSNADLAFRKLYLSTFPQVKSYVLARGKNEQDAEDVFQEALIVFYKKIQDDSLVLTSSVQGYIFGICKMLLMSNKFKKLSREVCGLDNLDPMQDEDLLEKMTEDKKYNLFQEKLHALPSDQQNVLQLFMEGHSSQQIAAAMGYGSEKYARKKKMVSKNKLVALIQAAPVYRELIAA